MQNITPCFWFATQAEEAANHYVSVFKNSKITHVSRFGDDGPGPAGQVMVVMFELDGNSFMALNGCRETFNDSVSFMIDCADQAEVDHFWDRLVEGGQPSMCGWLKDKFGVSWQVTPRVLGQLLGSPDPKKAAAAMQAMLTMQKIDIAAMQRAHDNA